MTTQGVTILLVDDDPDCRMLIHDAIEQSHLTNQVHEVTNGQEALDFLYRRGVYANAPRPGLIYLDIEMPGLDGHAVCRTIKADPHLKDIPVVMMTGLNDDRQKHQAAVNGANSYTLKPTDPIVLLQTVLSATSYWLSIHQHSHTEPGE
jgi:CheY-like chemotaxis protein